MTIIDRKQVIKNYVDNANEAFLNEVEYIIKSFENGEIDIWDELPSALKNEYERIVNDSEDKGISHEEMQRKAREIANS